MAATYWTIITITFNIVLIIAAPSTKLEDIAKVERADAEETLLTVAKENNDNTDTFQGQRQKRFYNYFGYGFPPMNPVIYPSRDDPYHQYGFEDPLVQIHRKLQDIVSVARTSNYNYNLPPPPPFGGQFPILFPVIFVPVSCGCTPNQTPDQTPDNQTPKPNTNGTSPDVSNRFPDMEDENQNWGLVVNETETADNEPEDFTRPISFEPIGPNRPMSRPPPPVEHGSTQAGASNEGNSNQAGPVASTTTLPPITQAPQSPPAASAPLDPPTPCDGAILSCCYQRQVTYDCFAVSGCPDPSSYGNPCDIQVILRVINRFQTFYGPRG